MNEKEKKLPKWVQQELSNLRSNVDYYKTKSQELKGDKKTNTYIFRYASNNKIPLCNNDVILFKPNDSNCCEIRVKLVEDGYLEIYGMDQLIIKSQASNICHIKSERY